MWAGGFGRTWHTVRRLRQMKNNRVAHICSAYPMTRIDRRPDRVEISPEQLSAAAIEAEVSSRCMFEVNQGATNFYGCIAPGKYPS